MSYEVTASKKRPQTFETVVGQDFVVSTLKSSLELGRIAHAYLFAGPRGVGKTSAARILAKALNCEHGPTPQPCGSCSQCTEIARGNSLDVIEIDGASNTSVNDVRELKDEVLFAPNSGRYKIYIIDEVHMLSTSAFNALLKTIEEPPPYIVFVFATTEVHKVPATIRSRCQQFNFRLIPVEVIKEQLRATVQELGMSAEEEALFWISKEATGSLRDAYTLFDQIASFSQNGITLAEIRDKLGLVGVEAINDMAEAMADEDGTKVISLAEEIFAQGVAVEQLVVDLAEYFRNILFLIHGVERESILGYPPSAFSGKVRGAFGSDQIEYALQRLFELYRNLRFSLNQRFETELVLSDLSSLSKRISASELVDRIDGLKREITSAGGAGASADPPVRGRAGAGEEGRRPAGAEASQTTRAAGGARSPGSSPPPAEAGEAAPRTTPPGGSGDSTAGRQSTAPGTPPEAQAPGGSGDWRASDPQGRGRVSEESGQGSGRALSSEEIESLAAGLKSRPSLASAVQKAEKLQIEGESLVITCDSMYAVNKIREEIPTLTALTERVIGRRLNVKVHTAGDSGESGESGTDAVDEQAELVKKVFRGHIVGNGAEHESDGSS